MGLKLIVDSLDGLDEGVKSLYAEKDGKFRLDVEGVEDVTGLKSALEKERSARRDLEKRMKTALSEDDLEEYARLKAEADKGKDKDEILKSMRARHEKELEQSRQEASAVKARLEKTVLESTATQLLAKHGGNVSLLLPHILGQLRPEEIDGNLSVVPASAATIDDVMSGLKSTYPQAFAAPANSGSGAGGGHGGAGVRKMSSSEFNSMRPKEQAAFVNAGGSITE
jgi:hypothetical protein